MENLILHTENITSKPTTIKKLKAKGITKTRTYKDLISAASKNNKKQLDNLKPSINLDKLKSKIAKIGMLNCDEINDNLNYFLFSDTKDAAYEENLRELETAMQKTTRVSETSFIDFYKNFKKYDEFIRKGTIQETCSNRFIEEVKNNCIIPNPVGIVKRLGDEKKINLKYHFKSNNYIVISSSGIHMLKHFAKV